ncbi:hypothetical protein GCM10009551_103580 [Nocardiopsis tropica]
MVRPADANETVAAWKATLERTGGNGPTGLILTRQNVPILAGTSAEGVARGGYVLQDTEGTPDVLLIGTGSEVQLAVRGAELLAAKGIKARVVSMPSVEWFHAQDQAYQDSVLPPSVKARVAVEAGIAQSWWRIVGGFGEVVSLEHFGESASDKVLFTKYGFTGENVAQKAEQSLANLKG